MNTDIIVANQVCSALSLIGVTFVIICYFRLKKIQSYQFRLVVYLCVSDLIQVIIMLAVIFTYYDKGRVDDNAWCQATGFLLQNGEFSSIVWVFNISYVIYGCVVKGIWDIEKSEKKVVVVTCLVTLTVSSMY